MNPDETPLVALPTDLPDDAAAQLLDWLYETARVLESYYAGQLLRHAHRPDERQQPLWTAIASAQDDGAEPNDDDFVEPQAGEDALEPEGAAELEDGGEEEPDDQYAHINPELLAEEERKLPTEWIIIAIVGVMILLCVGLLALVV